MNIDESQYQTLIKIDNEWSQARKKRESIYAKMINPQGEIIIRYKGAKWARSQYHCRRAIGSKMK